MAAPFVSLHGLRLGLASQGNLVSMAQGSELPLTSPCADCSITVGAEISNARAITIQLKDATGADINYSEIVDVFVFLDAAGLALATTGGSTGIAIGTDGAILNTVVAKKIFLVNSEVDGDIDLSWTDTGTEAAYLGVRLPNGRVVVSSALTNA